MKKLLAITLSLLMVVGIYQVGDRAFIAFHQENVHIL